MRLRRFLEKLPTGKLSDRDFHELMVHEMWRVRRREMEKLWSKMDKGVKEICEEILQQAGETQRRLDELDEMKRQETAKLKEFVRNKIG